jgi:hypothetical protein
MTELRSRCDAALRELIQPGPAGWVIAPSVAARALA